MPLGLYLPSYKATGCLAHLGNPTRTAVRNQFPRLHSDGGAELVAQYPLRPIWVSMKIEALISKRTLATALFKILALFITVKNKQRKF